MEIRWINLFASVGRITYWSIFLMYMSVCYIFYENLKAQKHYSIITGVIIGAIFVLIGTYYFYERFLVPYLKERCYPKPGEENYITIYSPGIWVWWLQWTIPSLALQIFVVLGFWIALDGFPLQGSIYTQSYKYGKIYKTLEDYKVFEKDNFFKALSLGTFQKMEETNPAQDIETDKKIYLQEYFKNYFNTRTRDDIEQKSSQGKIEKIELALYKIPFYIAFSFTFLGALIYTLKDTLFRFYTGDLYPKTYLNYIVRFIFAPSLGLVIAVFFMNDWPVNLAPLLFFFIGFFPDNAMNFLEQKVREFLRLRQDEKKEVTLYSLQGMTDYIMYRFRELGITDVQNLANVDLTFLRRNMAFSNRLLADFVSQAILLVHFKDEIDKFRTCCVRDIVSFATTVNDTNYSKMAQLIDIKEEKIKALLDIVKSEAMEKRISTLTEMKSKTDEKEKDQMLQMIRCR